MLTQLLFRMNRTLRKDQRRRDDRLGRGEAGAPYRRRIESDFWRGLWDRLWQGTPEQRSFDLQAYEDRLLYSAVPVPVPAPVVTEVVMTAPPEGTTTQVEPPTSLSQTETPSPESTENLGASTDAASKAGRQLIVVDPSVPDYETLLEQLTSQQSRPTDILVLDSQRDGLEQIAERLEQLEETQAIHILSHGDEAGLRLGSNWLSADTIGQRSNTLTQWQAFLSADADVLFYGCDLAANPTGQEFLRTFGQLTGADVAASTDATGAALLGGDWNLEFQFGTVETRSLGESLRLFDWNGLLTTNTYQQGTSGYTSTSDTSINSGSTNTAYGSGSTVIVGGADGQTGLIRFDNLFGNGPNQIPLGSTIHSASLRLNVTTATGAEATLAMHRVLTNWSEASTWNSLASGLVRDDVDVATVADAEVSDSTTTGVQTLLGLEESLQAWSDGGINLGWALYGDNATDWSFTSSEGGTTALRPMLLIDFTPPAAVTVELRATGEVRVNASTANAQSTSANSRNSHDAVGIDANGNYVTVWTSDITDGSGTGVYGQRYNARGVAQGPQFKINPTTTDNQAWASVAVKADGGFIVTWTSSNQDGSGQGVYDRIFTAAGVGGSEFLVNTTTSGTQHASAIGVAADGTFVIAWEGNGPGDSSGIFAQRFDASGGKLGGEILVNTTTANGQSDAAIAVGQDGQFMVVWDDVVGTHGRRFLADGTALDASQMLIHSDATSGNADVATNGTGDYHIAWRTTGGGDDSGRGLWMMNLGAAAATAGTPVQVTSDTINDQTEPAIASDPNGNYIITWQGSGPGDTAGVFARKFLNDGTAVGTEFQLNDTTAGSQVSVSAALLNLNNFVTVWSGNGAGDATGIFARVDGTLENQASFLFTTDGDVTSSGSATLASWTTGHVLAIGQPSLTLGSNTTGLLSIVGSINAIANDGNVKIEGLDVIQHDVLVAVGATQVQLFAGDVLFSVANTENLGGLTIQADDILVFRPSAPLNYANGTIQVLFTGLHSVGGSSITKMADFDLVDRQTQIGDVTLQAGDLIVADTGGGDNAIQVFRATTAGFNTTSGITTTLLKGSEFSTGSEIQGLHLVERDIRMGGITLVTGDLLVATEHTTSLGSNDLSVTENDVTRLTVNQTSVNGTASVTASVFMDGSDVALDTSAEAFRALAMVHVGDPPDANDETYTLTEDDVFSSNSQWHQSGWSSRMQLTFDNSSRAENLVDFPILVTLDTNRFDYSLTQANGADLRFVDANGAVLSYEIETWNPYGQSAIWVKVPQIDASSNTDSMWMYYGNSTAPAGQNPTDVWSNGYVGVWHLNGDPTGTQVVQDSSSTNVDGTATGMDATNQINGPIGGALKFDGSSEFIRIATTSSDPTAVDPSQLTIEAWANSTGDSGTWERIVNRRNIVIVPFESYGLATSTSDRTQVVNSTGTPDVTGTVGSLPEDRWRYLTGVLSGSTSSLYVDGTLNATQIGVTSLGSSEDDITIGAGEMGFTSTLSQYWTGGIDEVRLSNVARSAAWTAAQYASMTDSVITYGDRKTVTGLLDNDTTETSGGLVVTRVDLTDLAGATTAVVLTDGRVFVTPGESYQSLAAGDTSTKQIHYTVMDANGNSDLATATIIIQGVNDAPVIDTGVGPLTLTSIIENATNPPGNTVAAIIASAGGTLITDVDTGALTGIAVTAVDNSNGQWEYLLNGSTWLVFSGVSETNATLLNTSASVRFIPTANFSGSAGAITFRAWDQTSGTNGLTGVNASVNGGSTAFSTQVTTASISVMPVNTSPVVVTNLGLTVFEGSSDLLDNTRLTASDAENTPVQLVYTVSALPSRGRLERVSAPGTAITTFTQADLNSSAIRYVHDGGETTSDGFSFSLTDGALTVTGTFAITVTPVNDLPVITVNTGLTVNEGGIRVLSTTKLAATDADNTATQLVYTVSALPAHGRLERVVSQGVAITTFTQADLNSSAVRYVHDGGETTSDGFSFSVSDGAATATDSFSITVTPANDMPVVSTQTGLTVLESGTVVIPSNKLSTTDADHVAGSLTYTVTGGLGFGHLEVVTAPGASITSFTQAQINANQIVYVHSGAESTAEYFAFSVSDGSLSDTETLTLAITPVNDSSDFVANRLTISEGQTLTLTDYNLLTNDDDTLATSLVYSVNSVTEGRFEFAASPGAAITSFTQDDINSSRVRFVHNGGEAAPAANLSVTDGVVTVGPNFMLMTFSTVNDPPTISTNTGLTLSEGATLTISSTKLAASDPDNTAAQRVFTVSTGPLNGRLEKSTNAGVSITSFTQADINGGIIRYVHNGGETVSDSFVFSLSDGTATVTGTFAISVTPVNDGPLLTVNSLTVNEGQTVTLTTSQFDASDPDSLTLTFTVSSLAHGEFRITGTGATVTSFTRIQVQASLITFVHDGGNAAPTGLISVSDGSLTTAPVAIGFAFNTVNDPPVLVDNYELLLNEGASQLIGSSLLLTTDADQTASQLSYTVTGSPVHGRLERVSAAGVSITTFTQADLDSGDIRYVHHGGESVVDAFNFTVSDGTANLSNTFAITVTPVNDAPALVAPTLTIGESQTVVVAWSANDPDSTALTLIVSSVTHGLFRNTDTNLTVTSFTKAEVQAGLITFTHDGSNIAPTANVVVSDGEMTTASQDVSVVFTAINDAPIVTMNRGLTVNEGTAGIIGATKLSSSDEEQSATQLTYTVTAGPAQGQLERVANPGVVVTSFSQADLNSNAIRYVHDGSETTTDAFTFEVSDGASSAFGTFTITIQPTNDVPVLGSHTISVQEGATVVLSTTDLNASDPDNAVLTYSVSGITHALFRNTLTNVIVSSFTTSDVQAGLITFTHDGSEVAPTAMVRVGDGAALSPATAMLFSFTNTNDQPQLAGMTFTLSEDATPGQLVGQVMGSDPDVSEILNYSIVAGPSSGLFVIDTLTGELSVATGVVFDAIVTPAHDLLVLVTDQARATTTAIVHVAMTNSNDAPLALGIPPINGTEDGPALTIDLRNGFADPDRDVLTFRVVSQTNPGLLASHSIDASGQLTFVGAANKFGVSDVTIKASDPGGLTAVTTIRVTLAAVNDRPVVQGEVLPLVTQQSLNIIPASLLANDLDVDGDRLAIVITNGPDHGTLTANPDGTWTYTPSSGYSGSDAFEYAVFDGQATSPPVLVGLTVQTPVPFGVVSTSSGSGSSTSPEPSSQTSIITEEGSSSSSDSSESSAVDADPLDNLAVTTAPSGAAAQPGSATNEEIVILFGIPSNDDDAKAGFVSRNRRGSDDVVHSGRKTVMDVALPGRSRLIRELDQLVNEAQDGVIDVALQVGPSVMQLRQSIMFSANADAFEQVTESLHAELSHDLTFEVPALAGASLTVGYVVWMLRGGMLLTSLLAQMPAWQIVDPLVVLDSLDKSDEDDESLSSLVEQGQSESETV